MCLGFDPRAARMVGTEETTELWRPPSEIMVYLLLMNNIVVEEFNQKHVCIKVSRMWWMEK